MSSKVSGTTNGSSKQVQYFKDWPNDAGFADTPETRTPIELKVTGKIPDYVQGVLYRTGPGSYTIPMDNGQIFKIQHWFDGFALQHRFEITPTGKVFYRSRRTCDGHIERIRKSGKIPILFGQKDPCDSFFHKFFTNFLGGGAPQNGEEDPNVNVTLTPNFPVGPKLSDDSSHRDKTGVVRNLYVKTDANFLKSLDPVTLDPIESTRYNALAPGVEGALSAAHSAIDPDTGEFFNFVLSFGRTPTYTLFKLTPPTTEAAAASQILAKITDAPAAYIHSVCLTKKYFIFCVWQADLKMNGAAIPYHKNIIDSLKEWNPNRKCLWYIVDRNGAGVVRKYESETFFAFHHVNSYDDGDDVIVDLAIYPNHGLISNLYIDLITSTKATKSLDPAAILSRVTLPNISSSKQVGTAIITKSNTVIELPTISANYTIRPNRYAYGVSFCGLSSLWDSVIKVDLEKLFANPESPPERTILTFSRAKCTPSEPIFVPRPGAEREDDGVVLMVELDGERGKSALVVIDGISFKEIARAEVEDGSSFVVPHGFHGAWCGGA